MALALETVLDVGFSCPCERRKSASGCSEYPRSIYYFCTQSRFTALTFPTSHRLEWTGLWVWVSL